MKRLLLIAGVMIVSQSFAGDSNWFLRKRGLGLEASQQFIKTDKYFDNDGERQDIPDYTTSLTSLQLQYGITDRWNAGAYFPAIINSSADIRINDSTIINRSASSTGDFELFGKYKVYERGKSSFIATAKIIFPTGVDDNPYRLNSGFGSWGEVIQAEYIYHHNDKLYAQAFGGFLNRENDFTDEVVAGGDIAYQISEEIKTALLCRAINPLENGNDKKPGGRPGLAANNSGYIRLGLQLNLTIFKSIDLYGRGMYPVKGQFVQAAPVFEAGISILFNKEADENSDDN